MEKNIFLNDEEASQFRKEIKERGRVEKERLDYGVPYVIDRVERNEQKNLRNDIELLHGVKPSELIAEQLEKRKDEFAHRKFTILDMGGGSGAYADQLEDLFGDRVKIYTTGLAKQAMKSVRRDGVLLDGDSRYPKRNLPKNHLRWRSILELNKTSGDGKPIEEFDFIINSYGEIPYGTHESEKLTEIYLRAIIAKLRAGGIACISPFFTHQFTNSAFDVLSRQKLELLIQKIAENSPAVTLKLETIDENRVYRLKIYKQPQLK